MTSGIEMRQGLLDAALCILFFAERQIFSIFVSL
jgi:hypothetical protein